MSELLSDAFKAMARAEEAIEAAEYDISGGFSLAAANRAYYAGTGKPACMNRRSKRIDSTGNA